MARLPRLDIPGIPQHVVSRGVDRQACFRVAADYAAYLRYLAEAAHAHRCAVHAYALMTNHVHVLLTGTERGAVSRVMQSIGRRHVRRFNEVHERTGTLFEGRFRSSLVDSERYLFACMRYIELNPVRAGIVTSADLYRWSSYRGNVGAIHDRLLTEHPLFASLGASERERRLAYRSLVAQGSPASEVEAIRAHLNKECALGAQVFQEALAERSGRRTWLSPVGRPRRQSGAAARGMETHSVPIFTT
jgi:putative transposase